MNAPAIPTRHLAAVAAGDPMTLLDALAWAWPDGGEGVVGFGYGVREAPWWRLADGRPHGPADPIAEEDLYELVAFDGDRELRWLRERAGSTRDGLGRAVLLTETETELPAGRPASGPVLSRWNVRQHLLATYVTPDPRSPESWARLRTARYATALIPARVPPELRTRAAADTTIAVLSSVDYTVEDRHGNLTIAETRRTSLSVHPQDDFALHLPEAGASAEREEEDR